MNISIVLKVLGILLLCVAVSMFPSLIVAVLYGENTVFAFLLSILVAGIAGFSLFSVKVGEGVIRYREGFAIVSLGWLSASILGALPFLFTGVFSSFLNAFFESASGFTTTGATVIQDLEMLPYSLLFWRSFTHWLGGMGILVLALAVQPALGIGTFQILKAEIPGPISAKLTPRVSGTAKILYKTYLTITAVQVFFLLLGGMPLYDSLIHAFGTLGTGGCSIKNASLGAYNNVYYEIVITVFMIFAGVNFALYYLAFKKKSLMEFFQNKEFKVYLSIIAVYIIIITININGQVFGTLQESFRYASFQVASIITTTGYTTANFDLWPDLSRALILSLMFIGACAGSTSGSVKVIRIILIFKYVQQEINSLIHPHAVKAVKIGDMPVQGSVLSNVMGFTVLYIAIFVLATLLVLTQGLDLVSAATAVAACLGNIGPGLGVVGPSSTYASLTDFTKIILSFCMILGRLEIYTVIALLFPRSWKK